MCLRGTCGHRAEKDVPSVESHGLLGGPEGTVGFSSRADRRIPSSLLRPPPTPHPAGGGRLEDWLAIIERKWGEVWKRGHISILLPETQGDASTKIRTSPFFGI